MEHERAVELLRSTGALLQGHFLLTSGNHSDAYVQCALLLAQPGVALEFMEDIAGFVSAFDVDTIVAPAVGGILVSYEVARLLGKKALFLEREQGAMTLRRGFHVDKGERVFVVEDVITTGGSVLEVGDTLRDSGAVVTGFASIVNRSSGRFIPVEPYYACVEMEVPIYVPERCPLCAEHLPLVKPGSRKSPASRGAALEDKTAQH
jgi:orotate phosphoribosyltransferase